MLPSIKNDLMYLLNILESIEKTLLAPSASVVAHSYSPD